MTHGNRKASTYKNRRGIIVYKWNLPKTNLAALVFAVCETLCSTNITFGDEGNKVVSDVSVKVRISSLRRCTTYLRGGSAALMANESQGTLQCVFFVERNFFRGSFWEPEFRTSSVEKNSGIRFLIFIFQNLLIFAAVDEVFTVEM